MPDPELEQIIAGCPAFIVGAELGKGRAKPPSVAALKEWLRVPARSNSRLVPAVLVAARATLIPKGADPDNELPALPTEAEAVRAWLTDVAARDGVGPAKVCLLAAREDHRGGPADHEFDDLLALIAQTPFVGPRDVQPEVEAEVLDATEAPAGASVAEVDEANPSGQVVAGVANPTSDHDLDELMERLDRLRERAGDLAEALVSAGDEMRVGGPVDPSLIAQLNEYTDDRDSILREFSELGDHEPPSGFEECADLIEQVREQRRGAEEARQQQARAQFASVQDQVDALSQLLDAPDNPARAFLESALEVLLEQRDSLQAALVGSSAGTDGDDLAAEAGMPREEVRRDSVEPEGLGERSQQPAESGSSGPATDEDGAVPVPVDLPEAPAPEVGPRDASATGPLDAVPATTLSRPAADDEGPQPGAFLDVASVRLSSRADSGAADQPSPVTHASPEGDPPTTMTAIAELIARRQPAAASLVASVEDPDGVLARALRFNSAAYASGPGSILPTDAILLGTQLPIDALAASQPAATAAVAGAARAGLAAGWTHRALLDNLLPALPLDERWSGLFDVIVEATQQGYVHAATRAPSGAPRSDAGKRAGALRLELQSAKTKYYRATRVLQRLLHDDQPLGQGLLAVERWAAGSDGEIEEIRRIAGELTNPRTRERVVDEADRRVSTPQQRREDIIAGARGQLEARIQQVCDLLSECLEAARPTPPPAANDALRHRLASAAQGCSDPTQAAPVEAALLRQLKSWILDPGQTQPERGGTLDEILLRASLPLCDVPRDQAGHPLMAGLSPDRVAHGLLAPTQPDSLVKAYLAVGNLAAARAAADGQRELVAAVEEAAPAWANRLDREARAVQMELDRARVAHQMDPGVVSSAEARLRSVAGYDGDRYDLQMAILATVQHDAQRSLRQEGSQLRAQLAELGLPSGDGRVERVHQLISADDLTTAREYLFLLGCGEELPSREPEAPRLLEDFLACVEGLGGRPVTARDVFDRITGTALPTGTASSGLSAWAQVVASPQRQSRTHLQRVLGLLGLDAAQPEDISERGTGSSRVFKVKAEPLDGSIVPGLGSRSGHTYFVTVADKERTDPKTALGLVPDLRRDRANLLLLPWSLNSTQRRAFLAEARRQHVQALVVDAACVGYLAGRAPGSFRALQQITLPFATYPHYTPSVAGDVPKEVFVGRAKEAEQIVSPTGSLFVYGGRQLGKSALLRHIAATHTDGEDRYAIYVDLKARMIGEAEDPAHLWVVLLEEFKRCGIIGSRVTTGNSQTVTEHVRSWLLKDESRRLLLLLDEADLFLESEARQRREGNRVVRFANIAPLKGLMEATNRRFKPVFAGLHQVQRFHEISNTPLAHGGSDILIGPLDLRSALDLVERPMAALGYRFSNRDLIARLLAFTNYQASLIQIVCDNLVARMSAKQPAVGQPPFQVSETDLEAVLSDPKVRKLLAERLRWTIALEDRYLVIALVVAVLSLEHDFTTGYEPDEIRSWCRDYWPGGFSDMTARDFGLYLEEMEGLGVLVRRADGLIAARSPNVVAMLGSKAELEQQLVDGADRFELPHDYNPRVSRRLVRRKTEDVRSPLTEQDLQVLLPRSKAATGVYLVVGSRALGIDDVTWVLMEVARERDKEVIPVRADGFADWVTATGNPAQRGRSEIPVVDAIRLNADELEDLVDLAKRTTDRRKGQAVIIIGGPSAAARVENLSPRVSSVTVLERWSDEALRSWSEGPFGPAENRERTLAATSGWPRLVHEVARRSMDGKSLHEAVTRVSGFPETADASRDFLDDVGIAAELSLLTIWADMVDLGEPIDPGDLDSMSAELDVAAGAFAACAERMRVLGVVTGEPGTVRLDPVVHRALRRLSAAPGGHA